MAKYGSVANGIYEAKVEAEKLRQARRGRRSRGGYSSSSSSSSSNTQFDVVAQRQIEWNQQEQEGRIKKQALENQELENELIRENEWQETYGDFYDEMQKIKEIFNEKKRQYDFAHQQKLNKYQEELNAIDLANKESNSALTIAQNRAAELKANIEVANLKRENLYDRLAATAVDVELDKTFRETIDLNGDGTYQDSEIDLEVTFFPKTSLAEWDEYMRTEVDPNIEGEIAGAFSLVGGGAYVQYVTKDNQIVNYPAMNDTRFVDIFTRALGDENSDDYDRYEKLASIFKDKQGYVDNWKKQNNYTTLKESYRFYNQIVNGATSLDEASSLVSEDMRERFNVAREKEKGKSWVKQFQSVDSFIKALNNPSDINHGSAVRLVRKNPELGFIKGGSEKLNQIKKLQFSQNVSSMNQSFSKDRSKNQIELFKEYRELITAYNNPETSEEAKKMYKPMIDKLQKEFGFSTEASTEEEDGVSGLNK